MQYSLKLQIKSNLKLDPISNLSKHQNNSKLNKWNIKDSFSSSKNYQLVYHQKPKIKIYKSADNKYKSLLKVYKKKFKKIYK